MPRFHRNEGYYTYEPRAKNRRYVLKKDEKGRWIAESYKVENGTPGKLRMKHCDIPQKRDASELVDFWCEKGY